MVGGGGGDVEDRGGGRWRVVVKGRPAHKRDKCGSICGCSSFAEKCVMTERCGANRLFCYAGQARAWRVRVYSSQVPWPYDFKKSNMCSTISTEYLVAHVTHDSVLADGNMADGVLPPWQPGGMTALRNAEDG